MSQGLGQLTVCTVFRLSYEVGVSILCLARAMKAYSQGRSWFQTRKNASASYISRLYEHIAFPFPAGSVLEGGCLSGISLPYHSLRKILGIAGMGWSDHI